MDPATPVQHQDPAIPANKKKSRKKSIAVVAALGLAIAAVAYFVLVAARIIPPLLSRQCFQHSFGRNCEFPAWDGGRRCTHDGQCSSGMCLYPTNGDPLLGSPGVPYEASINATSGTCDTYEGDNDGVMTCHKADPDGPVSCIMVIS